MVGRKKNERRGTGGGRPKGGSRKQPSRYSQRRRVPWVAVLAGGAILIAAVLLARSFGVGEVAVGTNIATAGVGQHPPEGQPITYAQNPPVGGPHWPTPALWGISTQAIPDERAVHNLEHGGVVISQNGMSDADQVQLRSFLAGYPKDQYGEVKVVVRPYDKIPKGTIVLTAWSWTDALTAYDASRIKAFLDAHLNKCCENGP